MIKTEAIILKTADLGETDRLLTIYAKEFGKIQILAKGVKKLESKLRYHLEPLSYSFLILIEGKNFKIVKDAVLINQFLNIKKNLEKIRIAYKIINLINELIVGEEKDEDIWNLLIKVLQDINGGGTISHIEKEFRDNLLKLLGYRPEFVRNLKDIY